MSAASPIFNRIAIIGLGLIGSSIARAARQHGLSRYLVGCDRNEVSLAYARKAGFVDSTALSPEEAVADCDLVILATPPSTLAGITAAIAPALQDGAIIMDVASVKQAAIDAIAPHLPVGVHFIPAHPIAGSEQSGVSAGRTDLFQGKRVIVAPEAPRQDAPMQHVIAFWRGMGARVEAMPPHLHDLVYAYVSHLPQLLAFAVSGMFETVADNAEEPLKRFLRLGASPPELWLDIFMLNKEPISNALDRYLDAIIHIGHELDNAPADAAVTAPNPELARMVLFPRIAASCLITTVMEAERKAGFSFARYAGTGFADFTAPATQAPDTDMEAISGQYREVGELLREYTARLKEFSQLW